MHPSAADLDIRLFQVPLRADRTLAKVEAGKEFGRIAHGSAMDCRVIHGDAALCRHLLEVAQAQTIGQAPPHAQQHHRTIELPTLEHLFLPSSMTKVDVTRAEDKKDFAAQPDSDPSIYERLRDDIIHGRVKPNERLKVAELA